MKWTNEFVASLNVLPAAEIKKTLAFLHKLATSPETADRLKNLPECSPDIWAARVTKSTSCILKQTQDKSWLALHAASYEQAYRWAAKRRFDESDDAVLTTTLLEKQEDDSVSDDKVPDSAMEEETAPGATQLFGLGKTGSVDAPGRVLIFGRSRQRIHVLTHSSDLLRMIDAPKESWIAFIHPSQEKLARQDFTGPAKVTGTPGTGKTVLALHRARHLARQGFRVLLTSFARTLCNNLDQQLRLICTPKEKARISVNSIHKLAREIIIECGEEVSPCGDDEIEKLLAAYKDEFMIPLDQSELLAEWRYVIQRHGITSWEEYQQAVRTGRGFALGKGQRAHLWQLFQKVLEELASMGKDDWPTVVRRARVLLESGKATKPFDCIVVDETQDLGAQELQFLAALAHDGTNSIIFVGDGGQRIYPGRVSLKDLGIDVRGRSHVLHVNYRMTEDIRTYADSLLGDTGDDLEGEERERQGVLSMLAGPVPIVEGFPDRQSQLTFVLEKIKVLLGTGMDPADIAVFARRNDLLESAAKYLEGNEIKTRRLDNDRFANKSAAVNVGTMHAAKGLEFKAVFVIDVSANVVPPAGLLERLKDSQAADEFTQTERQLVYVSMTRARYYLYVTWTQAASEFLTPAGKVAVDAVST